VPNCLGIITGLASEAALVEGRASTLPIKCRLSGARPARAYDFARALIAEGCSGLVSFGMAGGLDPGLAPGTLVIANQVIVGRAPMAADSAWVGRIRAADPAAVVAPIADSAVAVCGVEDKRRLREASGAVAVDMESGAVALAAFEAGIPFAVIRAVADPADRAIPAWVTLLIGENGKVRSFDALCGVIGHPWDLPALLALGKDSRKALDALGGVAARLGGSLGFLEG
jgi:adenosylhomocysteine nucleosidase